MSIGPMVRSVLSLFLSMLALTVDSYSFLTHLPLIQHLLFLMTNGETPLDASLMLLISPLSMNQLFLFRERKRK
jgi:hypothetical protein